MIELNPVNNNFDLRFQFVYYHIFCNVFIHFLFSYIVERLIFVVEQDGVSRSNSLIVLQIILYIFLAKSCFVNGT
jgi:hypothetical protein